MRGRRTVMWGLLAAGVAVPWWQARPWFAEHGPDAGAMTGELAATPLGRFFGSDVALAATTLLVLAALDGDLPPRRRLAVAAAALAGPSAGLPAYALAKGLPPSRG